MKTIHVGNLTIDGSKLFLIAGPCVIEGYDRTLMIGREIKKICERLGVQYIFKASFDKANRSSYHSFRGPGLEKGLEILADIKKELQVPVLSDVHDVTQLAPAAQVLDMLQIPAFLCRQTDLVYGAAKTGKPVNVKKGQFMAPEDMKNVIGKMEEAGNPNLALTERGASFGYHNLVVDMRSFPIMRQFGYPVILMRPTVSSSREVWAIPPAASVNSSRTSQERQRHPVSTASSWKSTTIRRKACLTLPICSISPPSRAS